MQGLKNLTTLPYVEKHFNSKKYRVVFLTAVKAALGTTGDKIKASRDDLTYIERPLIRVEYLLRRENEKYAFQKTRNN